MDRSSPLKRMRGRGLLQIFVTEVSNSYFHLVFLFLLPAITSLDEGLFIQSSSSSSIILVNGIRLPTSKRLVNFKRKESSEGVVDESDSDSTPHRLADKDWVCFGPEAFFVVCDPRHPCPDKPTPTMASARRQIQQNQKSAVCSIL